MVGECCDGGALSSQGGGVAARGSDLLLKSGAKDFDFLVFQHRDGRSERLKLGRGSQFLLVERGHDVLGELGVGLFSFGKADELLLIILETGFRPTRDMFEGLNSREHIFISFFFRKRVI